MRARVDGPISAESVVDGVATQVEWWIGNRRKKLLELRHDTHAVNPFMMPVVTAMHGFPDFRTTAAFMLAGHLVEGHSTGFGKLIDEKILPRVFLTTPVDRAYRAANPGFMSHEWDNVDHLAHVDGQSFDVLSLKAGKWSIQLGQAVQLNRSFQVLTEARELGRVDFGEIVVGVFYGTTDTLTDKYQIIRGVPTKTVHDVEDISEHVRVLAGRDFWAWLNCGESATQEWVLEGVQAGFDRAVSKHGPIADLFEAFIDDFAAQYARYIDQEGEVDWFAILREING